MKKSFITLILLSLALLSACTPDSGKAVFTVDGRLLGEGFTYSPQSVWNDTFVACEHPSDVRKTWYILTFNLETGDKSRIFESPEDFLLESPSIYENWIVWAACNYTEEISFGPMITTDMLNWDVFLYDLGTGEVKQITTDGHTQISPRIYGNTIVWLDNRDSADKPWPHYYDVYAYDISTGKERRLTTGNSIESHDISISGNLVAWTDNRNDAPETRIDTDPPVPNHDIYLYNLSTEREQQITTDSGEDYAPVIDNGRILFQRKIAERNVDLFLYDTRDGTERQISTGGYVRADSYPGIDGKAIVWADTSLSEKNTIEDMYESMYRESDMPWSRSAEIYSYNLSSQKQTLLVSSEKNEFTVNNEGQEVKYISYQVWRNPVISSDFLVCTLSRQAIPAVYVFNLDKNTR
jgi:beta propeller repeat protein